MTQFFDFGLAPPVLRALEEAGYTAPTPIQSQAIPPAMEGRDLCGIAQTGTGKTAAFALPILHRLSLEKRRAPRRGCRVLVLSPTRELASQIAESFSDYGRHLPFTNTVVFGGVTISRQERALASGIDILVATPGRLIDLVERRALSLEAVEILVLDEADQMLDLGFIHALKRIVRMLPRQRQSLFFSATMPRNIADLAAQYLADPVQVAVTPVATTAERVEQRVIFAQTGTKQALLGHILRDPAFERVLVFTRTKHGADRVVRGLDKVGIGAAAIHGNKSQPQRERALAAFKDGSCRVLVATDIAARGIDVEAVSHVVNYDLPNVPESYVHRIGRTARAGAAGLAVSFCNDEERAYLRDIERLTRQKVPVAGFPEGFVPPSRQEAAETAAAEARRPPRQPQARPGPRHAHGHGHAHGKPRAGGARAGGRGVEVAGEGRPERHETRAAPRIRQESHRQESHRQEPHRQDQNRQDRHRHEAGGERRRDGRAEAGRPARTPHRDHSRPSGGAGGSGQAIGWLGRAPRP